LNAQVQKLRYRANLEEGNWARSIESHKAFIGALIARDASKVEQALRAHVLEKKALAVSRAQAGPAAQAGDTGKGGQDGKEGRPLANDTTSLHGDLR
jgi:DNA-binding GntR family transcriptional regulator